MLNIIQSWTPQKTNKSTRNKSKSSATAHSRKSIPILIILAFLLVISALGIINIHGLRSTLFEITAATTDGKIYLLAECHNNSSTCHEETEKLCKQYDGKEIGTIKFYQKAPKLGGFYEINATAASKFLITSLDSVPENKIPVLVPDNVSPEKLDPNFMPVGTYVGSTIFNESAPQNVGGIFAPILSLINSQPKPIYMINDGSNKIEKFLLNQWSEANNHAEVSDTKINELISYEKQIITFDNYKQAINYQRKADKIKFALVDDIFGDTLAINYAFNQVLTVSYWVIGFIALLTVAAAVDVIIYLHQRAK